MVLSEEALVFVEDDVKSMFHFAVLFAPGLVWLRRLRLFGFGEGKRLAAVRGMEGVCIFRVGHIELVDGESGYV